jgi:hypothetical protein
MNDKSPGYVAPAVWFAVAFAGGIVLTENAPDGLGWVWRWRSSVRVCSAAPV